MIYQMHPNHGRHMPSSLQEAESNEKHGWKTVTEEEFYREANAMKAGNKTDSVDDDERVELITRYVEKFSERPHHRCSNATIKAKLDD
jgi:hypothetical protein